jgi:hypothetical protein
MTTMEAIRKQATEVVLRKLVERGHRLSAAERRTLDAHVAAAVARHVEKHHEEARARPETLVEKVERARGYAAALNDAVTAYSEMHKCSRATAVEMVLAHPSTTMYHRLDRDLRDAQREVTALHKLEGTANIAPINRSTPARTPPTVKPSESGAVSQDDAPAADPDISRTSAEVLEMIANAQLRANPTMTRARATSMAALDPRFSAAHRDEKMRKGL